MHLRHNYIWEKVPVYFLIKKSCITLHIYIDLIFKSLDLLFYNQLIKKKSVIIWIHNGTSYHTLKLIIKFYFRVSFLCMNWPLQLLIFNLINNFWRIIKIRINSCRHQVCMVEELKVAILKKIKEVD